MTDAQLAIGPAQWPDGCPVACDAIGFWNRILHPANAIFIIQAENEKLRLDFERLDIKFMEQSLNADRTIRDLQLQLDGDKDKYQDVIVGLKRDLELAKKEDAEVSGLGFIQKVQMYLLVDILV